MSIAFGRAFDHVVIIMFENEYRASVRANPFMLSGILTPANKVDYASTATGTSNGYGTLAEAGWTKQVTIEGIVTAPGAALALAQHDSGLVLLSQPQPGGRLLMSVGRYDVDSADDKDAPS